jgi:hypothetical protein
MVQELAQDDVMKIAGKDFIHLERATVSPSCRNENLMTTWKLSPFSHRNPRRASLTHIAPFCPD